MTRRATTRPTDLAGVQRILIYAVTGSGKTTLAARLAQLTGLPWHSVDDEIGWEPGAVAPWRNRAVDDQLRRATELCAGDRWILDTAYRSWRGVVLARVDLVVALDYPRWVSLSRLLRRTVRRIVDRREVCNGNVETLRQVLSSESIIVWHFRSFPATRRRIRGWLDDPSAPATVCFTRPSDLDRWVDQLENPVV